MKPKNKYVESLIALVEEVQLQERAIFLSKLRKCLAQMPVAGNGRRLIIQLLQEYGE